MNILQKGNGFLLCRRKLTFLVNAFFSIRTCKWEFHMLVEHRTLLLL